MQENDKPSAHACFRLDIQWPLSVTDSPDPPFEELFEIWHSLSYRILRKPADLLAHTRRIRLCTQPALQDRLAGALMDLDHVLGDRGYALRVRLQTEAMLALGDNVGESASGNLTNNSELMHTSATKGRVLPSMTQLLQSDATPRRTGAS